MNVAIAAVFWHTPLVMERIYAPIHLEFGLHTGEDPKLVEPLGSTIEFAL